jgi:hypothetical protein
MQRQRQRLWLSLRQRLSGLAGSRGVADPRPATRDPERPRPGHDARFTRGRALALARPARLRHHCARLSAQSVVGNTSYCAYPAAALRAALPSRAVARATVRVTARASAIRSRGSRPDHSDWRFSDPSRPRLFFSAPRPRRPRDPAKPAGYGYRYGYVRPAQSRAHSERRGQGDLLCLCQACLTCQW